MKTEQRIWRDAPGWSAPPTLAHAQLVLAFGDRRMLGRQDLLESLAKDYPSAHVVGCTSAGEIAGLDILDDSLVATAVAFDATTVQVASASIDEAANSYGLGMLLAKRLPPEGLAHVILLADGLRLNGSELVRGILHALPAGATFSGGLAGDGRRFQETFVLQGLHAAPGRVLAIGLYGTAVRVGFGSAGGWRPEGPQRLITRAVGSVVFEIDGRRALDVYREVCGDRADALPAAGLLYPLLVVTPTADLVRTLLAVDEEHGSVTFAGDVPEGPARIMTADHDALLEGAASAARDALRESPDAGEALALLVSCVGRRMLMEGETSRELAAVAAVLGPDVTLAGFYSYGEICPVGRDAASSLHNQTMTVTFLHERPRLAP